MECRVQVVQDVRHRDRPADPGEPAGNYELCLQKVRYCHFSGEMQEGFRFIWRDTAGKQLASRGQARLPSLAVAEGLIRAARRAGWGSSDAHSGDWSGRSPAGEGRRTVRDA